MKRTLLILLIAGFTSTVLAQNLTIDQKVDSLLNLMTLDEKIGQMTQAERGALENISDIAVYSLGSLLSGGGSAPTPNTATAWANMYNQYQAQALQSRLGIPIIYGVDAVHGHNNVYGAVIFPHNIGMGCTWDTNLVRAANQVTAREVAATGIDWTFSPCIAVPQNERWGRTYEGFGETPEIQKLMATASVLGLQGPTPGGAESILACAKHYVGDGGTTNGTDQGNTEVSEEVLREIHMAGYIDAIDAGVGSVMASYNSWNGQKLHGHDYLLSYILKTQLGFRGFVVSDWKGVDQLDSDYRTAVKKAINAGVDMVMVPDRYIYFISILKDLVESNEVSMSRIDDAVKRILKQKFLLNLFEKPFSDNLLLPTVGSAAHRNIARQAVRESLVLLAAKNDVLPLHKTNQKILVAGSMASNLGGQCGGWTISWQGGEGDITTGTKILTGIQNMAPGQVIYSLNGETTEDVDVAVVVIGEKPYAEGAGDRSSLNIEGTDVDLVKKLKDKGIPVVTILVSGRPMVIGEIMPYTDAFIAAWLPGTEGDGIAQVLFGDYTPQGKLTHSWPKSMNQLPLNVGDANYDPMFAYKHGLQSFPASLGSTEIIPYGAALNKEGNTIVLGLSDKVTSFSASAEEFTVFVDGIAQIGAVSVAGLSDTDSSMLSITLNQVLNASGASISLGYSGSGIHAGERVLSPFDNFFVYNGMLDFGLPINTPGKVEAEDYFDMSGVATENCTDVGGGLNVGWIEDGDYMKYFIKVNVSGNYKLVGRIAGFNAGTLFFQFNDSIPAHINFTSTNGWQNWQDFSTNIYLESGTYVMKVFAYTDGFNINYYNFQLLSGIGENSPVIDSIMVVPNPGNRHIQLNFNSIKPELLAIGLYTMTGKLAQELYDGKTQTGPNQFNLVLDPALSNGNYVIELRSSDKRYFTKFILTD
ncbi:MAG: glycoside hydrolase family 3 C-terminal domain-containing protein [Bacteroidetes bacterium]|nr:glycoside hydrolase family 3 C-terminal domain-containing protein [Bacteroidota bacterium]